MNFISRYNYVFVVAFLFFFIHPVSLCQKRTLLVAGFQDCVSKSFKGYFKDFKSQIPQFTNNLVHQIMTSKALEDNVKVDTCDHLVASNMFYMYQEVLLESVGVISSIHGQHDYYLIGYLSDDTSNIAFADAYLYRSQEESDSSPRLTLQASLHAEGSWVEAYNDKMSLEQYLAKQLLSELEAQLDERIRVLIVPFEYHGKNQDIAHLGGMVSSFLRSRLNVSQRIRVIMQDSTYVAGQKGVTQKESQYRPWTLPEQGKREAAKYVVGGSFFEYNQSVGVEASYYDVETGHSVLSKAVFTEAVGGSQFYNQINKLGDDLRRAIELDYDNKRNNKGITFSVVAVPPYPPTEENKAVALEIVNTVTRKLRGLASVLPAQKLSVLTDHERLKGYVSREEEKAVMSAEMNVRYLLLVSLERPERSFNMNFELFDTKNPNMKGFRGGRGSVQVEGLGDKTKELVSEMIEMASPFKGIVPDTMNLDTIMDKIEFMAPERSVAVIAAPPYTLTGENKSTSLDIAQIVSTKLSRIQSATQRFSLIPIDRRNEAYIERGMFNVDSIGTEMNVRYIWIVKFSQTDFVREVIMELSSVTNPYEKIIRRNFLIEHIDDLNSLVGASIKVMLKEWLPGLDTVLTLDGTDTLFKRLDQLKYRRESASVRMRGSMIGFLDATKDIFLGNNYQIPVQYEFTFVYDAGKRLDDKLVYGRYFTISARYNFSFSPLIRDMRVYAGGGVSWMNLVRVWYSSGGRVAFGINISGGFEIPISKELYFDINSQQFVTFSNIGLGHFKASEYDDGHLSMLSFGLGIGYRF